MLGAVIAAYAPSLQMRVVRHAPAPGWRFTLALALLGELAAAQADARRGLSVAQLAETLRRDPLQIEPVLDVLLQLDWIGRLDEDGVQRTVLLVDPARTPLAPLLARLLIEPQPGNLAFLAAGDWSTQTLAAALPVPRD
jgi:membrane protein